MNISKYLLQKSDVKTLLIVVVALGSLFSCSSLKKSKTQTIVNGAITVANANYNATKFSTQRVWSNIQLTGEFSGQRGQADSVRALVMTMLDFINFANGEKATFVFDSGVVPGGKIDLNLPSQDQDYALVFYNTSSGNTPIQVTAQAILTYK